MSASAEAKHVRLVADLEVGADRPFFGDRSRLHQALVNLVKNAVEAEPEGGTVRVMTRETRPAEDRPALAITVHNDNSYIPEEQLDLIFRPFYTRRAGGTGLGLPVCQTIIEEHHGAIRVTSKPGAGTSFIVELPLDSVAGETAYDRSVRHRSQSGMV
jgi:two-component system nitrogen regulation sensor histidine kinase GlnL